MKEELGKVLFGHRSSQSPLARVEGAVQSVDLGMSSRDSLSPRGLPFGFCEVFLETARQQGVKIRGIPSFVPKKISPVRLSSTLVKTGPR